MSEVMQYQSMANRVHMARFSTLILMAIGAALYLLGVNFDVWIMVFSGLSVYLVGIFGVGATFAIMESGKIRRFYSWLGADYTYPPLEEWKDNLKERGEFEVNYE